MEGCDLFAESVRRAAAPVAEAAGQTAAKEYLREQLAKLETKITEIVEGAKRQVDEANGAAASAIAEFKRESAETARKDGEAFQELHTEFRALEKADAEFRKASREHDADMIKLVEYLAEKNKHITSRLEFIEQLLLTSMDEAGRKQAAIYREEAAGKKRQAEVDDIVPTPKRSFVGTYKLDPNWREREAEMRKRIMSLQVTPRTCRRGFATQWRQPRWTRRSSPPP